MVAFSRSKVGIPACERYGKTGEPWVRVLARGTIS